MCGRATSGSVRLDRYAYPSSRIRGRRGNSRPSVRAYVAELDERDEETTCGSSGESGDAGDLAQRQLAVLSVEGTDDRQAALERLDEVESPTR